MRRRTRPSLFARIRAFWIVAVLVLLTVAGAFAAFANAPQLRVRDVDAAVPEGAPVSRAAVLAAAAIASESNVLLLNAGAIRDRVEAIPYVATARVRRTFVPQPAIAIGVTLRSPYACLTAGRGRATIDATGRVLQAGCLGGVPLEIGIGDAAIPAPGGRLVEAGLRQLLTDAVTIAAKVPLRALRRDRFGGVDAVDRQGVTIRFGADGDLAAKLALVDPIRRSLARGRAIRTIDLRAPNTPVVEFP
jgi:cell division protein FtsQ